MRKDILQMALFLVGNLLFWGDSLVWGSGPSPSLAAEVQRGLLFDVQYEEAKTGERKSFQSVLHLPELSGLRDLTEAADERTLVSDIRIEKSLFLLDVVKQLRYSLISFEKECARSSNDVIRPLPPVITCQEVRIKISQKLLQEIGRLTKELNENYPVLADEKTIEVLDLSRMLARNIKTGQRIEFIHPPTPYPAPGGRPHRPSPIAPRTPGARAGGMNLTAGGAQDFESFKKIVREGFIPPSSTLPIEGFLSEFDLSLSPQNCLELVCLNPAYALNPAQKKLFVQLGMSSMVTEENFIRPPLNLSVVLDISGSMAATDNTEKSRLEWAKESLFKILEQLGPHDYLSIILFDTDTETLLDTEQVRDRKKIMDLIRPLQPKGTTNLEKGLRDGFGLVSRNFQQNYENRVILISDAGLNTGVVDDTAILKLVSDYASEDIGLTAIGLGLNFNQKFINKIGMSKGGNYLFVHSGAQMLKLVKGLSFLVTPVAYHFKVNFQMRHVKAKLVQTYGVPSIEENPSPHQLIDIRTLFFSPEGGGAILLEFDLLE